MKKNKFKNSIVAVLDNGVNADVFSNIGALHCDLEVLDDGSIIERMSDKTVATHGTVCAAILKKYAPNVKIASIKIMDDKTRKGTVEQTILALNWCAENGIRVINISAACEDINATPRFAEVVRALLAKGHVIVAALSNFGHFALPAGLNGVFRVKADSSLRGGEVRCGVNPDNPLYIEMTMFASGEHILSIDGTESITVGGDDYSNSNATPVVTAYISNMLNSSPNCLHNKTMQNCRPQLVEPDGSFSDTDIPVILFMSRHSSNSIDVLETAKRFHDFLVSKDFSALVVSDYADAGCDEVICISALCWEQVARTAAWFNVDIIIVCATTAEDTLMEKADAHVYVNSSNIEIIIIENESPDTKETFNEVSGFEYLFSHLYDNDAGDTYH